MTGGTYSAYRFAYGVFLASVLVQRAIEASVDPLVLGAAIVGALVAIPFALGFRDRLAALALAPAVLITGLDAPSIVVPIVTIAPLAAHVGISHAPYGSLDARGRPDPAGEFAFPRALTFGVYAVLAGAYAAIAMPMVRAPSPALSDWAFAASAALFLVLGLAPSSRIVGWVIMLGALVGQLVIGDHPLIAPLFFVHLLAFDGDAIPPKRHGGSERVFYDGGCGLCHRAIRFALAEDPDGEGFRFAPLGGEAFEAEVPQGARDGLPDSIVLLTRDGELLVRSAAVFRMMEGLGGLWRVLGTVLGVVPRPVADLLYDFVARIRHRLFAKPKDVCPIIPKHLRPRFDL